MRKRHFSLITAILLLATVMLPGALPASAEDVTGNFEAFTLGNVNGQDGWSMIGPFDVAVVANTYGYASFGSQSLRISDAVTSGSFGDQTFAKPLVNAVGETAATAGTFSAGIRQTHFEMQFDIASTQPGQQPGMHLSVSPDRGDGSRMSYLRFEDGASGIDVFFDDVQQPSACTPASCANFVETQVATSLPRATPHTVKLTMDTLDGPSNDVVKVYIDGTLVKTGTSWEDYYRYDPEAAPEASPRIVKTVLFRESGTATTLNLGKGYLIDNLSVTSSSLPVTPADTSWVFYDDGYPGGIGQLVSGPATPPLGIGSVRLALPGTVGAREAYGTAAYAGIRLDKITKLQYYTYRSSVDAGNNLAIALQLDMDYDLTDANTGWQGRLVYEPYMGAGGTVLQDTWQQWNALAPAGKWWASGLPGKTLCPQELPCTWSQVLSNWPNAGLRAGVGYFWLKAGGPADGFDGNADALTVGVNSLDTTYDLEPTDLKATTTDPLFCVGESTTVNIDLAGVANLYGYQFKVNYTNPTLVSAVGAFDNSFFNTVDPAFRAWDADCSTAGVCKFSVTRTNPQTAISGSGTLAKITFTGVAPGTSSITIGDNVLSDIDGAPLLHSLGAPLPITVCGNATVSGFITMQGRPGNIVDAGTVTLTEQGSPANFSPVAPVPFNPANGAYSIQVPYMPGVGGSSYKIEAAHGLYLTNAMDIAVSGNLVNQNTRLWGGDATNDGRVKIEDLACIGGHFGDPLPIVCATTGSPDINADNKVNIQDLSIAGGNLDKCGAQPWDWANGTPVTTCP